MYAPGPSSGSAPPLVPQKVQVPDVARYCSSFIEPTLRMPLPEGTVYSVPASISLVTVNGWDVDCPIRVSEFPPYMFHVLFPAQTISTGYRVPVFGVPPPGCS